MRYGKFVYPVWALILAFACHAQAESPKGESPESATGTSEPRVIFKRLRDYVKNSPLDFKTSFDARMQGDELFRGSSHFLINQPNLLRIETSSGDRSYLAVSDGTVLTIYNPRERKFAQMPAPGSPSEAFGLITGEMGVESQVLRFLDVVDDVVAGADGITVAAAGSSNIGGRECDRFTITGQMGESWEAWLDKKDVPLPCKLINHGGTVQTNEFTWTANPVFAPATFVFSQPEGSEKVDVGSLGLAPPG